MALKKAKPFQTYSQQIAILRDKKHLVIDDVTFAEEKLRSISYYALIDGYKDLFYDRMNRIYRKGTRFGDIVALYDFDERLRAVVFKGLCHIEQRIKSLLSYGFCSIHSEHQSAYLDPKNYSESPALKREVERLVALLQKEACTNTEHPYIVYQRETYGNVPLWVMMKTLTFGQMSKMYALSSSSVRTQVSIQYNSVNEAELTQLLSVLTKFRNVCAHNERLFSYSCIKDIPDTVFHKKLGIAQKGEQYLYGKHDLFAVFIAFRMLLPKTDFIALKRELQNALNAFFKASLATPKPLLFSAMDFPENWTKIIRVSPQSSFFHPE